MTELEHLRPLLDMMAGATTESLMSAVKPEPFESFLVHPASSIVVSGSRIEGISNPVSDLDLYVLAAEDPRQVASPIVHMGPGFYTDAEIFTFTAIEALKATVDAAIDDPGQLATLTRRQLDNYYRLSISVPVYRQDAARDRLASLSKDRCSEVFASWCAVRADACCSALTEYRTTPSADERAIYSAARLALEWALDSWLAGHGEAFPSRKWRFEKLARRVGTEAALFADCWGLKASGDLPTETYAARVRDLVDELLGGRSYPRDALPFTRVKGLTGFNWDGMAHVVTPNGSVFALSGDARDVLDMLASPLPISSIAKSAVAPFNELVSAGLAAPIELGIELPHLAGQFQMTRLVEAAGSPAVSRSAIAVTDYVDRLSENARISAVVGAIEFDLLGASVAGQRGLEFVGAHDALAHGAAAAIVREVGTSGVVAENYSLVPLLRAARLFGEDDPRTVRADELSRRNPSSQTECDEFVDDCLAAIGEFGLLPSSKWQAGDGSNNFLEASKEIKELSAAFGLHGQLDDLFDVSSVQDDQRIRLDIKA